jgi:hypothetical protein
MIPIKKPFAIRFNFIALLLMLVILQKVGNTLAQDTSASKLYLGTSLGLSVKQIGSSQFLGKLGANVLYNWDTNNFVSLSYNRVYEFHIPFGVADYYGNASFHRLEMLYGYTMIISKKHKLFKHLSFAASIGVSYNYINYFRDDLAVYSNHLFSIGYPGIPIGITISNNIGHSIYFGWELKYHIIQKFSPYGEVAGFIMVNIY